MGKSEELLRLERDLKEQPGLLEKLDAECRRILQAEEAESDGELLMKAAAALGYAVTAEELERSSAEMEKLDDDELNAAGGGRNAPPSAYDKNRLKLDCLVDYSCAFTFRDRWEDEHGHDRWCPNYWHCYTLKMHTSTERKDVSCLSDYMCVIVSKTEYPDYDYSWVYNKD